MILNTESPARDTSRSNNQKDVSIIIPVYNTEKWLPECIESVISGCGKLNIEILLVDDQSTDSSREIIDRYTTKYEYIYAYHQSHGRQGKARNTGLRHASGKYILFLDSDDRIYKNALTKFYQAAERYEADFVVGIARSFSHTKKWINEGYQAYQEKITRTNVTLFPELLSDPSVCNKLYRQKFIEKYALTFPENTYCEDVGFIYSAYLLADSITILPEILHEYRGRGDANRLSGTQTFTPEKIKQCAKTYRSCLETYRSESNPSIREHLEKRTIIRLMRFFRRLPEFPDADAFVYRELQHLFALIQLKPIVEGGDAFTVPFIMIRQGCFRHAVAVLNRPDNSVATDNFFELLKVSDPDTYYAFLDSFLRFKINTKDDLKFFLPFSRNAGSPYRKIRLLLREIIKNLLRALSLIKRLVKLCYLEFWDAVKKSRPDANDLGSERQLTEGFFFEFLWKIVMFFWIPVSRRFFSRKVWLVGERSGIGAEESGYVFFKYCIEKRRNEDVYFILNKKVRVPSDFPDQKHLIRKGSFRYLFLLGSADRFIFTNSERDICPRHVLGKWMRGIRTIFLTHGVTLYGPGVYLRGAANRFDRIVSISDMEKTLKVRDWNIQNPSKIKITGLPRFDVLKDGHPQREILFCPTWRNRLNRLSVHEFSETLYFKKIRSLFQNASLQRFLKEHGMTFVLRFHFRMEKMMGLLGKYQTESFRIEHLQDSRNLSSALREAKLLITDYSSILWDMAYMLKPVVLYQFDVDAFLSERGLHGFSMDENEMRFASRVETETGLMDALTLLAQRNFELTETQKKNAASFFRYRDNRNCERVFEMIQESI